MSTPPCQVLEPVSRPARQRSGTALALAGVVAFAAAACFDTAAPHPAADSLKTAKGALPATTPALSVAGPHYPRCSDSTDSVQDVPERSGTLGWPIARQLRCRRYTVVVAVPLPPTKATPESPELARFRTTLLLRSLFLSQTDHVSLKALADYLRLSPNEPFTFGTRVDVSEDGSMSLKLEPKGGGGRLMLIYKLEL